jgi:predicted DsbA family dithiol-disulfide isomerase
MQLSSQKPVFKISEWFNSQHCVGTGNKPVEIYVFIDPLCPECWAMEPNLKKLLVEYGQFFSIKHILSGKLTDLNFCSKVSENMAQVWERTASRTGMSCDGSLWFQNPISSPYNASIAIKAAELQGRRAGTKFLRKLRELMFLEKQNISDMNVLTECARSIGLDVEEFINDITSEAAAKAFQCDLKISSEMEVTESPTVVFFNQNIEEEGIKVSGAYPYEVYVTILEEMLGELPSPAELPPIETFIHFFGLVATKEIAVVYNMKDSDVEREMKKLVLQQKIEKMPVKYGTFWKYVGKDSNACK